MAGIYAGKETLGAITKQQFISEEVLICVQDRLFRDVTQAGTNSGGLLRTDLRMRSHHPKCCMEIVGTRWFVTRGLGATSCFGANTGSFPKILSNDRRVIECTRLRWMSRAEGVQRREGSPVERRDDKHF